MARSLVISHQEEPGTSRLFNAFLLIALGWMIAGIFLAGPTTGPAEAPIEASMLSGN